MFSLLEKIDKALESKENCTLIDKMGKYFNGQITDSFARFSGGKIRGKFTFSSKEKGVFDIDVNDVLDIQMTKEKK